MSKHITDISQIRKYLNGELDARAMHRLERRAQDDPFLMDALEGYQTAKRDQGAHVDDLKGRLTSRVTEKKGRIIPFRIMGIAASILLVCSVGVWWFSQNHAGEKTRSNQKIALTIKPEAKTAASTSETTPPPSERALQDAVAVSKVQKPLPAKPRLQASPKQYLNPAGVADAPVDTALFVRKGALAKQNASLNVKDRVEKDTTPLNEMIVMGYTSPKKKDTTGSTILLRETKIKTPDSDNRGQVLKAKVDGVTITTNRNQADLNKLATRGTLAGMPLNQVLNNQTINGQVFNNNGAPIKGASVKVEGTDKVTKTDAKGRFRIKADTTKSKLLIAETGYKTRQVSANNRDSVKNIALEPKNSALGEMGSGNADIDTKDVTYAHPQKGWGIYRKYLKVDAVSPDGKDGVVTVTFTVGKDGSVNNIKVVEGLSEPTNKKAINLIKNGPGWVGSSTGEAVELRLRVRFSK